MPISYTTKTFFHSLLYFLHTKIDSKNDRRERGKVVENKKVN